MVGMRAFKCTWVALIEIAYMGDDSREEDEISVKLIPLRVFSGAIRWLVRLN